MADNVVAPLLKHISVLLQQEWRLASDAKTDLQFLKNLVEASSRILMEANSKEVINEKLKAFMKQARKFLYDSQDAIDDFMRRESNSKWEGLGSYFYEHYSHRTLTSEAIDIKKMLANYHTAWEITAAMENLHQLSPDLANSSSACHWSSSITFSEENDDGLVSIGEAREQLVQWLTENDSMSKVIFVHGAQGVGKSSLVGAVLRDQRVRSHFKYYVWIKDLRSCELVKDKVAELMKANAEIWNLTETDNQGIRVELKKVFEDMRNDNDLRNNKLGWALVLDDAGTEHVFESLWSHLDQTRPSVLVTTRISSLASKSSALLKSLGAQSGGAHPKCPKRLYGFHHFKHVFLSMDDSRALFFRKMFATDTCPPFLMDASHSILVKCEGSPLAILATCNLLIGIQGGVHGTAQSVEWQKLSGKLGEALLFKGDTSDLIRRMITLRVGQSHAVPSYLLYLSVFPLDCRIRCSTLMRLWMAETFIKQNDGNTIQIIPEETLDELVDHNLIQEVEKTSYGRVRTCRIHNLLHQIIISKSKDVEFVMIVDGPIEGWPETIPCLSFHSQMDSIKNHTSIKQLRSLLVFKKVYEKSIKELLRHVRRIRVLDLEASSLNSFPREILSLHYLKYLSLRGTKVNKIPNGIGDLVHLETLDLKDTPVQEIPDGILKLTALCHLLVYRLNESPAAGNHPRYGVKAPSQLGVFTSLQKLCLIELNHVKRHTLSGIIHGERVQLLAELGKLENLRKLGISNLRSEDAGLLCSSVEKLKKLEALHLIAATDGKILDLSNVDKGKISPFLQRVHLTGGLGTLPNWILSPNSLVKLVLKRSQLNENPLQRLRNLQCLKHLELQEAFDVREMTFNAGGFQQLCFLGLDMFDNLESIRVEEEALPALERLSIARCQSLTTVPQVITRPERLKCLELYDMPEEFMTAVKGMNVECKDWKDGAVEEVLKLGKDPVVNLPPPPICKK